MINLQDTGMGLGRDQTRKLDLQSDSHLLPDTLPTALRGQFNTFDIYESNALRRKHVLALNNSSKSV